MGTFVRPCKFSTIALSSKEVRRSRTICLNSGISGRCFFVAVCRPTAVRCFIVFSLRLERCLILWRFSGGRTWQCSAARLAMASHREEGYSHSSAVANRQPCSHLTPHGRCLWVSVSPLHHTSIDAMAGTFVTNAVFLSLLDPHMQALNPRK